MLASSLLLAGCQQTKYEYPFQNPKLKLEKRVDNLLSLLTLEEKVGLMQNGSISIDRLDIPAYNWWNEACHGICYDDVTVFPQVIALGATFDAPQQYEIYSAVSDEARAVWNTTDHHQLGVTQPNGSIWHNGLSFWSTLGTRTGDPWRGPLPERRYGNPDRARNAGQRQEILQIALLR